MEEWIETIQDYIEWNLSLIERTQDMRERGQAVFAHDTPISIDALKLRIEDFKGIPTPKNRDCKKIRKTLEDSMKMRLKGLEQELKYYADIQKATRAGRFGRSNVAFDISMSDDLLKTVIADIQELANPK